MISRFSRLRDSLSRTGQAQEAKKRMEISHEYMYTAEQPEMLSKTRERSGTTKRDDEPDGLYRGSGKLAAAIW